MQPFGYIVSFGYMVSLLLFIAHATPLSALSALRTYAGTPDARPNPERGFRHETQDMCFTPNGDLGGLTAQKLAQIKRFNLTVVQTYCYLPLDATTCRLTLLPAA
eukprot:gene10661-biopygen2922